MGRSDPGTDRSARFAREAVYLPELDLVMFGYHLDEGNRIPFYDIANNRWLTAEIPARSSSSARRREPASTWDWRTTRSATSSGV